MSSIAMGNFSIERWDEIRKKESQVLLDECNPTAGFPDGSRIVVRAAELVRFVQCLQQLSTKPVADDFPENERDSVLKLIYGMAIAKYDYDPEAKRNPATGANKGSIVFDLDSLGLRIDEDTLRKYLKQAKEKFGVIRPTKN